MSRHLLPAIVISALGTVPAAAQVSRRRFRSADLFAADRSRAASPGAQAPVRYAAAPRAEMGGGFVEFLFGGGEPRAHGAPCQPIPMRASATRSSLVLRARSVYGAPQGMQAAEPSRQMDPRFKKQVVSYDGKHAPGTIVIDTPNRFLYLVQENGKAVRYGIGVGREGFRWSGVKSVHPQGRVAGLDTAAGNAQAPPRPAASHGRRPGEPARARAMYLAHRSTASMDRTSPGPSAPPSLRLYPHAQRGCHRPLRAR